MPLTHLTSDVALVMIDLQYGIVGMPIAPNPAGAVVARSARLAEAFRAAGRPVFAVRVDHGPDGGAALRTPVDRPGVPPNLDPHWSTLVDELGVRPGDIVITKRQWSAFHGTDLDDQLRRRGVRDVVVTGLVTTLGVESSVRQSWEHGYRTIVVADAISGPSAEEHDAALRWVLPRISQVDDTDAVLDHLAKTFPPA
ncbi:isochorismatase family protein [Frankia sp. R82]|uniref:isochorismatase family protein n=1 Tax=Frankia sp. R82 TaxID=2950553 RepID=UPI0020431DB0|nr:isochorismatase family protein [Frankia sp. R82]MCM3882912.1 isochorismatase family protein [Frankia sp. R82]